MNQFKLKHQFADSITTHRFQLEVNDAYVTGEVILSVSPLDATPFDIEVAFDSVKHLTQDEKIASELYVTQAIKNYYTQSETN
jgi:hypothetical protein